MKPICLLLLTAWAGLAAPAANAAMRLSTTDFKPGGPIAPAQIYGRCGGRNISPQLAWSGAPAGARSLVLTMIDLDVRPSGWSHWIVVNLPPASSGLPRGVKTLPPPAVPVAGNFGDAAYDGPCPPAGTGVHHYRFTLWAMPGATTRIAPDAKADAVAAALAKTALDSASITGLVTR